MGAASRRSQQKQVELFLILNFACIKFITFLLFCLPTFLPTNLLLRLLLACLSATLSACLFVISVHKAGTGRIEAGRGIGLRFPRFLRERTDKRPEQATSSEQIVEMFFNQGENGAGPAADAEDDDDELI
jgi:hypothetical protein